jgi:hypothetical protein
MTESSTKRLLNVSKLLAPLLLVLCLDARGQATWQASTLPASGDIAGAPGTSAGWGYAFSNPTGNWLVLNSVASSGFQFATPSQVFDFPVLKPFSSVVSPYASNNGLYAVSWALNAAIGSVDTGYFVLTADWWSGDPSAGGSYLAAADSILLAYSATVGSVPEAPTWVLLGLGAMLVRLRNRPLA